MLMTEPFLNPKDDIEVAGAQESPRHGDQGDRGRRVTLPAVPAAITVAMSREAGARGGSIARRVAAKLGWQLYRQETLEYIAQESNFRQDLLDNLAAPEKTWVEENLDRLLREQNLSRHPSVLDLARIILSLGASGAVILVGRGAGCILPAASTLHVRVVAALADRVAFMAQWLRLTTAEAAQQVQLRDSRRAEFVATHFHRNAGDIYQYDLVLNSTLLGEELAANLIVQAARARMELMGGAVRNEGSPPDES
jgi:cytidylate kinase